MKISMLCSNADHPVYPRLQRWCATRRRQHEIELVQRRADLTGGDLLFLISCHEVISVQTRSRYGATLVIHASDLPEGRGWSPHVWQILAGHREVPVTLVEAEDKVDSGAIWAQRIMRLEGHELYDEINDALFAIEFDLMDYAVDHFDTVSPHPQDDRPATYLSRRTPKDSRVDPCRSLAEQFDLLRVADPERFPAFFDYRGHRYILRVEKADDYAIDD
jgi:methionyl-tRNA formyltransferase